MSGILFFFVLLEVEEFVKLFNCRVFPYGAFATSLLEKSPTENWRHEEATIAIERKRLRRVSFTIFYNLIEDNRRWRGGSSGSHSRSRHPCL